VGVFVTLLLCGWVVVGGLVAFPTWWQTVLYSTTASTTFVMVFVIQHTQSRQQSAMHRKLDELLRSANSADNQLIAVEEAAEQELEALADLNLADRDRAKAEDRTVGPSYDETAVWSQAPDPPRASKSNEGRAR